MGPVAAEAALEVALDPLGKLSDELLRRRRTRSRPVADLGVALQAQRVGEPAEGAGDRVERLATVAHQRKAMLGELAIPRGQRVA